MILCAQINVHKKEGIRVNDWFQNGGLIPGSKAGTFGCRLFLILKELAVCSALGLPCPGGGCVICFANCRPSFVLSRTIPCTGCCPCSIPVMMPRQSMFGHRGRYRTPDPPITEGFFRSHPRAGTPRLTGFHLRLGTLPALLSPRKDGWLTASCGQEAVCGRRFAPGDASGRRVPDLRHGRIGGSCAFVLISGA